MVVMTSSGVFFEKCLGSERWGVLLGFELENICEERGMEYVANSLRVPHSYVHFRIAQPLGKQSPLCRPGIPMTELR
jgi:hypothetical protein